MPKHNIKFKEYKHEMQECVEIGAKPVFGYPLIAFEDKDVADPEKDYPEQLKKKFRRGRPVKKR